MGLQLANDIVAVGLAPDVGAAVQSVVDQTPLGRLAEVSEVADAIVFLCSQEARFITGAGLPVDGGMGMRGEQSKWQNVLSSFMACPATPVASSASI